jgi:hypothetical protein
MPSPLVETTLGMMTAILVVASDIVFVEVGGSPMVPAVRFDEGKLEEIALARVFVSAVMRLVDDCSRVEVAV